MDRNYNRSHNTNKCQSEVDQSGAGFACYVPVTQMSKLLRYTSAWLGWEFCEVIPLVLTVKQHILMFSYRYNSDTGFFRVPLGGNGTYYFSTFVLVRAGEMGKFEIKANGQELCRGLGDQNNSGVNDYSQAVCSGVANLQEGQLVSQSKPVHTQTHTHFRNCIEMHFILCNNDICRWTWWVQCTVKNICGNFSACFAYNNTSNTSWIICSLCLLQETWCLWTTLMDQQPALCLCLGSATIQPSLDLDSEPSGMKKMRMTIWWVKMLFLSFVK